MKKEYVIGLDFGTDSVRALVADAGTGKELALGESYYPRWKLGKYCDPATSCYRQHPLDYLESMELAIRQAVGALPSTDVNAIIGMAIDCTGSTPAPADASGTPLALLPGFEDDPEAMFILWKDHSAQAEADEINRLAKVWAVDYTAYSGFVYSPEWFWSKILHVTNRFPHIRDRAFTWVEHCDWIPALLTANRHPLTWRRSRTAAGHKAMWHENFNGLPSAEFLHELSPYMAQLRQRLYSYSYPATSVAGILDTYWAQRLGLPEKIVVAVGTLDAHSGAIGAGIDKNTFVKVVGTSTCDLAVVAPDDLNDTIIQGICGQVEASILPGMMGLEAGQSAFGDLYNWFANIIATPVLALENRQLDKGQLAQQLLDYLGDKAASLPITESDPISVDWLNGRRTPDPDLSLSGAITGLRLGTSSEAIFKSLVESTAFGSLAILQHLESYGIQFHQVKAVGGISKKSPYVMQVLADVLERPIVVPHSNQACALGAAMIASVASGIYSSLPEAGNAMQSPVQQTYLPNPRLTGIYRKRYLQYRETGRSLQKMKN